MKWFESLFHKCEIFKWEIGYGMTPQGLGQYQFKVCRECKKATGECCDFVSEQDLYEK